MDKPSKPGDGKGTRILARTFYRELRENGYSCNQILALATELIDLVTRELRSDNGDNLPAPQPRQENDWRQVL